MKYEIEVEGLPEGWKAVAFRKPNKEEQYFCQESIWKANLNESYPYLIVEKIQPRRIVLEETDEIRFVKHGEYYEASGQVYRFTKDEESSHKFKVWREVKENS